MTMQLFSFGHPCEHQLRRTCIGGSSCPLNGYPDMWCCSFIKGKINFKRDKPCEGPRCRWGFTHPTQAQFDAVTNVLNESRTIASTLDDAEDDELLSFQIDNQHVVDTVLCTLHMMRHPPSTCAKRVGQLLAYAAAKMREPKVFMQLLKTMKKPVDGYILGAYFYLTNGVDYANMPLSITAGGGGIAAAAAGGGSSNNSSGGGSSNTTSGGAANATNATSSSASNTNKGNKKHHGNTSNKERKDDVTEDLKNDMVDLMNAALSQGGHLVNREDQHHLQIVFIQALKHYPKSNRKRAEMYEAALAKFGTSSNNNSSSNSNSSKPTRSSNAKVNSLADENVGEASSMTTTSAAATAAVSTVNVNTAASNSAAAIVGGSNSVDAKESSKKGSAAHKRDKTSSQRNEAKEHHMHNSVNHNSADRDELDNKAYSEKYDQRIANNNNNNNNNNSSSSGGSANSVTVLTHNLHTSKVSSGKSSATFDIDKYSANDKNENESKAIEVAGSKVNSNSNNNTTSNVSKPMPQDSKKDINVLTPVVTPSSISVKTNSSHATTPRIRRSPAAKPTNTKAALNDLALDEAIVAASISTHGKDKITHLSAASMPPKAATLNTNNTMNNSNYNSSNTYSNLQSKQAGLPVHNIGDARMGVTVLNATEPEKSLLRENSLSSSKANTPLPSTTNALRKTPDHSISNMGSSSFSSNNDNINNSSTPQNVVMENRMNNHQSSELLQPSSTYGSAAKTSMPRKQIHNNSQTLISKEENKVNELNDLQGSSFAKGEIASGGPTYEQSNLSRNASTGQGQRIVTELPQLPNLSQQQQQQEQRITQLSSNRISKLAELMRMMPAPELTYDPIRIDLPLPDIFLFGGQFALTVEGGKYAPLGMASTRMKFSNKSTTHSPELKFDDDNDIDNVKDIALEEHEQTEEELLEVEDEDDVDDDDDDEGEMQQNNAFFMSDIDNVINNVEAMNAIHSNGNMFSDDLTYNEISTEPMFEGADAAELLNDIAEGWTNEENYELHLSESNIEQRL